VFLDPRHLELTLGGSLW